MCFHPIVDVHGNICLDILQDKWSSAYDVRTILISIQSLLGEPNTSSPLNIQVANLWVNQEGGLRGGDPDYNADVIKHVPYQENRVILLMHWCLMLEQHFWSVDKQPL